MRRRGRLVAVIAAVFATGCVVWAIPALAGTAHTFLRGQGGRAQPAVGGAAADPAHLQVFYTPPVLVRAGDRVVIPVDAACLSRSGRSCAAQVTLSANAGGRWTRAGAPASAFLRFDVSEPAARALANAAPSASVSFTISARTAGVSTSLGTETSPLRFYVVRHMSRVAVPAVPFGPRAQTRGTTALYLPWGAGPHAAGVAVGAESATLGPSSFSVAPGGVIDVLDGLQGRLASFRGGRLVRSVSLGRISPDADVAASAGGDAFVSSSSGGAIDRAVSIRRIAAGAATAGAPSIVGRGIPERLDAVTGAPNVLLLPEDEWRSSASPGAPLSIGRPLVGGGQLLSVARGRTIRLGTVVGGVVRDAVELSFDVDLGELALAERTRDAGYLVVVHVYRDGAAPADQYQVVRVIGDRVVSTFAVARHEYAHCDPLSRFRLAPDGDLYELASSSDGIRVVRFGIGGEA